jgi:hypothetical protein
MAAVLSEITWTKDTIMAIGVVLVMAGVPLASILGWYWMKLHQTRSDNALKQSMVDRGMSADEIERVMAAGAGGEERSQEPVASSQKPVGKSQSSGVGSQ